MKSKGKSVSAKDCQIRVSSKKYPQCFGTYDFTMDYLIDCSLRGQPKHLSVGPFLGVEIWKTLIPYKVNSKFGTPTVKQLELNENWGAAIGYHTNDWVRPPPGKGMITPASLEDEIFVGAASQPRLIPPQTPLTTLKIDGWDGAWRMGSDRYGKGTTTLQKKWVRFIDHGEHQ
jgi:hypothetical protein